jgi:hypothetical protein
MLSLGGLYYLHGKHKIELTEEIKRIEKILIEKVREKVD